ncbi:hypothetical protein PsW64_02627 [Pseudovibrio sp. W64]|uniref:hypothetical protein n=1 Tax=unclassified Pseudovibrio TaxID=2627060 RepID=UPI0007AECE25|nr:MULTISPECIES: hypothetical protein [unclassified Pseudovibrio]KZK80946.1 hypothetical protein PsW64_02627 [Pseudovibrio sp. W64]KZK87067.1 hypothetical protein PsAD13_00335 [Pseudovibrio sp. Ad13]KZK92291.1 hypothetical protein PsW74_05571 [Pseudovibrio sp. W74]KZL12123.1 hypothetical protein PsAD14_00290 [Pseudovibrio sp. Ad14]
MSHSLIHWIRLKFAQHELWAINFALLRPQLSLFGAASLWAWIFPPLLSFGVLIGYLMQNYAVLGSVINLIIGLPALILLAYWVFRWYFICLGLMFGRRNMAEKKRAEVSARIEKLLPVVG